MNRQTAFAACAMCLFAVSSGAPAASTGADVLSALDASGKKATASIALAVKAPAPTISVAPGPFTFLLGAAIAPIAPVLGRSVTAVSISPDLAATGLVFHAGTGRVSGTPTAPRAATTYTLTARNATGQIATAQFSLALNPVVAPVAPAPSMASGCEYTLSIADFQSTNSSVVGPRVFAGSSEIFPGGDGLYRVPLTDSAYRVIVDSASAAALVPLGAWEVERAAGSFTAGNKGHQDDTGLTGYVSYVTAATVSCNLLHVSNVKGADGFEDEADGRSVLGKAGNDQYTVDGNVIYAESSTTTAADLYTVAFDSTPPSVLVTPVVSFEGAVAAPPGAAFFVDGAPLSAATRLLATAPLSLDVRGLGPDYLVSEIRNPSGSLDSISTQTTVLPVTLASWDDGSHALTVTLACAPGAVFLSDSSCHNFNVAGDVWKIFSLAQLSYVLAATRGDPGATLALAQDIDAGGKFSQAFVGAELDGLFDGAGHAIRDLNAPLFQVIASGATVKNLTLQSAFPLTDALLAGSDTPWLGGVALVNSGAISSCQVSLSVQAPGLSYVALVAGKNYGTIDGVTASGPATGYSAVGGLAGESFPGSSVTNSAASGDVSASYSVGGAVGIAWGANLDHVRSSGSVTTSANGFAGGLVGLIPTGSDSAAISFSSSSSNVSGGPGLGGLVGVLNSTGTVLWGDAASGNVVSTYTNAGGLVGRMYGGSIAYSTASGSVSGTTDVGGLVGFAWGNHDPQAGADLPGPNVISITGSSANGASVTGTNRVGGLVGAALPGVSLQDSFSSALTVTASNAGDVPGSLFGYLQADFADELVGNADSGLDLAGNDFPGAGYAPTNAQSISFFDAAAVTAAFAGSATFAAAPLASFPGLPGGPSRVVPMPVAPAR
jgi:hypothetical protein